MTTRIAEPQAPQEQRLRMTYDEFVTFAQGRHAEWVDGEVTVFVPSSLLHQEVHAFLVTLLKWFVRRRHLGRVVAPFAMRVPKLGWWREPDILFVASRHLHRLDDTGVLGPADLVVELVSDESVARDVTEKRRDYADAEVPEYWLVDPRPNHRRANFFLLEDGAYREAALDDQGRFHSRVLPGFWLDPSWLWQDPLPEPDDLKPLILATLPAPPADSR
jgi:Uma2 family endonuclease